LASLEFNVGGPGVTNDLVLNVTGGSNSTVLGLLVEAADQSGLDPAAPQVQNSGGEMMPCVVAQDDLVPVTARDDLPNSNSAVTLLNVPAGAYKVIVGGEDGTFGAYRIDVFLPGDLNSDAYVNNFELQWSCGAQAQTAGTFNHVTEEFYMSHGINLRDDLYRQEIDANYDGTIDHFDLQMTAANFDQPPVFAELIGDQDPPVISGLKLAVDDGRLPDDNIASDPTIIGNVVDQSAITQFQGRFAGQQAFTDLLGLVDANGDFTLNKAFLATMPGSPVAADGVTLIDGPYTLELTAEDEHGNAHAAPVPFSFVLISENDPPAAENDPATVGEDDGDTPIDVLSNDTDPNVGDTKTVVGLDTAGTVGLVTITNNGADVTYNPNGQFEGLKLGDSDTTTFTYTMEDAFGAQSTATVTVTIQGANDLPVAVDDDKDVGEDAGATPIDVLLNDTDPDADDTKTVVDLDTTGTIGQVINNGTNVTYNPNGQFEHLKLGETATDTFTYKVRDGQNADSLLSATVTVTIIGANDLPVAVDDDKRVGEDDGPTAIDVLANDTDPDAGDTKTVVDLDTTGMGLLTITNNGADVTYDPNGQFESLQLGDEITFTFTYTMEDGQGAQSTATITVTIVGANDPPTAENDPATVGEDYGPTAIDVLANDTDPGAGDTKEVVALDTTGTVGLVTITNNGADVTYDPNGQFEHLQLGDTDTTTFTYTMEDGQGAQSTATVTVTIEGANDAPVVDDQQFVLNPQLAGQQVIGTIAVQDPDTGDTHLYLPGPVNPDPPTPIQVDPVTGQISVADFALFDSLPDNTDFTFLVGVDDFFGGFDDAVITVTVLRNEPPVAADDAFDANEDGPSISGNVFDANPPSTGSPDFDPSTPPDPFLVIDTGTDLPAQNGGVYSLLDDGSTSYDPNGQFEHLKQGELGSDSFQYTIQDTFGGQGTATVTITIHGQNDLPVAVDDLNVPVGEDAGATLIDVLDNDTDPDANDTQTVVDLDTTGTIGQVINNGANVTYNPNGQFEHLKEGETATDTFTYKVRDGQNADSLLSATVTVTIQGANDAPVVDDQQFVLNPQLAGQQVIGTIAVQDPDTGDTHKFAPGPVNPDPPTPIQVDPDTGVVSVQDFALFDSLPDNTDFTFTVDVTDMGGIGGLTDDAVITVTVLRNEPPVAADDAFDANEEGPPISGNVFDDNSAGPDFDPSTPPDPFQVIASDIGTGLLAQNGGVYSLFDDGSTTYDPNGQFEHLKQGELGSDSFQYTIQDTFGGQGTATVTITILGQNDAPTAENDPASVGEDDGPTAIDVLANDTDPDAGDTKTVVALDTTGTVGQVINNGTDVTYNPNGQFEHLKEGETATDTFTYKVRDGQNADSLQSATVTVTIQGANDLPVAVNDDKDVGEDDGATAIDVLDNDTDPDAGDTKTVVDLDTTGTVGQVINNGTNVTYNPNGQFEHLKAGETATDTFTYKVRDGENADSLLSATVTVTIIGANDAPTAVDDDDPGIITNEDTPIQIDVLLNDTDPDAGDTKTVQSVDLVTHATLGAVTITNNGADVEYDPRGAFDHLAAGETATDKFNYTMVDGQNATSTATVTVTVTGVNDEPECVSPPADIEISNGDPLPNGGVIDLSGAFNDAEGHQLGYSAVSSNEDLVQVSVVGSTLTLTYDDIYTTAGDRTPSVITVTAKEQNTADQLEGQCQFTVTVQPTHTYRILLIARDQPTDLQTATDGLLAADLPASITQAAAGRDYIIEMWAADDLPESTGTVGAGAEIAYDPSRSFIDATDVLPPDDGDGVADAFVFDGAFDDVIAGSVGMDAGNPTGVIEDFGAGTVVPPTHEIGRFRRIGYFPVNAAAAGDQTFSLIEGTQSAGRTGPFVGGVDPSQIALGDPVVIQHVVTTQFEVIPAQSLVVVTGTVGGLPIEPQQVNVSDRTTADGSVDVLIDDFANPSSIQIFGADLTLQNTGSWQPGVGGAAGDAPANLGLLVANLDIGIPDTLDIAVRDAVVGITTAGPLPIDAAGQFSSVDQDWQATTGTIDFRARTLGDFVNGTEPVEGDPLADAGSPLSSFAEISQGTFELRLPVIRQTTFTIGVLTVELQINGLVVAQAVNGSPLHGTDVAEGGATRVDGTGLYTTLVRQPTDVGADGQVAELPGSEAWIDEWDSYWVEMWVSTTDGPGVAGASVDLAYDGAYFTATHVEHGPAFTENAAVAIDDAAGLVANLGGSTALTGVGTEGFALLGRVTFESLAIDQVAVSAADELTSARDLGLALADARVQVAGVGTVDAAVGRVPGTELWPVVYDVDDNDKIDVGDLAFFAEAFQEDVLTSDSPFVWALDFDKSGTIDIGDLSFMATNFQGGKASGVDVVFPTTFVQRWIGSAISLEGSTPVGELLDAAVSAWQKAAGTADPVDVQLVVQDFGDSQIGEGQILEVDAEGRPVRGRVSVDDDAAGLGWSSELYDAPADDRYDLYTVLLHEVGHVMGFTPAYGGFAGQVESGTSGNVFVGSDFTAQLDASGQHLDAAAHPGDVMNPELSPGTRKLPSTLDAKILEAAYASAAAGASDFSSAGAALRAAGLQVLPPTDAVPQASPETGLSSGAAWSFFTNGRADADSSPRSLAPRADGDSQALALLVDSALAELHGAGTAVESSRSGAAVPEAEGELFDESISLDPSDLVDDEVSSDGLAEWDAAFESWDDPTDEKPSS
jgi:VCBS repeat-containing protein